MDIHSLRFVQFLPRVDFFYVLHENIDIVRVSQNVPDRLGNVDWRKAGSSYLVK